jgi:hypothetical protein
MHQFLEFILFCSSTLHVSDGLSIHHQESKTVHMRWNYSFISFLLASSQQNQFDMYLMLYVES